MEKLFSSQQSDETVKMIVRRHIFVMFPVIVSVIAFYIIGLSIIFFLPIYVPIVTQGIYYTILISVVTLFLLFTNLYCFIAFLLHYLNILIITTEHLVEIEQKGLFNRKIATMDLENIQDVAASQAGAVETFYNYGRVNVQTAGELPNFDFQKIPNPHHVAQMIMELKEQCLKEKFNASRPMNSEGNLMTHTSGQGNFNEPSFGSNTDQQSEKSSYTPPENL